MRRHYSMKKPSRLLFVVSLAAMTNLVVTGCAAKPWRDTAVAEVGLGDSDGDGIKIYIPAGNDEEAPKTFTAQKVSGLSAKDAKAFADAMETAGWSPKITCRGNYCDIGTREHFETAATVVFLSGHGYVGGGRGGFFYSNLEPEVHQEVARSYEGTEYYTYPYGPVWTDMEEYCYLVSYHQKQITDWLMISACNQLSAGTRGSIFEAMNEPSEHPLKGVLGYNSYQGNDRDPLVLQKFVELCLNGTGKGRVAHAWFAAHEAYEPLLSPTVRVALRDGFENATLTSLGAGSEDADNQIKLWWMSRGEPVALPNTDIPEEVAVEIAVNGTADNRVLLTDVGMADPGDPASSQGQAVKAAAKDGRVPADFQLYRTNTMIESDMDGKNEIPMATLHVFARYVGGIRVSVDPLQGEYLGLLMDGTESAELDLLSRCQTEIDISGAKMAAREDLLSKEEIVPLGIEHSRRLREEHYGYAPEEITLGWVELVYVISPDDPQKMVLAWYVVDNDMVEVIMDAGSGEVLYWSN